MSRRKGWMFFVLGLMLALGAGALVFVVLQQQAAAAAEQSRKLALEQYAPPPTMKLPVAARPLVPGVTIAATDYVLKDFPLDFVPLSAITQTAELDGQFVVSTVGQGETFRKDQFLGSQAKAISQQIPQGKVLFAIPIIDLLSKSNVVQDGDHIDLMLTITQKGGDNQAQALVQATGFTLQNIEVFKVLRAAAEERKQGEATAFLASVTPEDAVLLKALKDSGGTIDFTLRSPADTVPFDAPPINQNELIDTYKLK